jgi:hypothetical protein
MSFLIAHLALTSQQHPSLELYIASTPAFCIRTCFEDFPALLSVSWKFAILAGKEQEWKVVVVHWGGFLVRLLLLILLVSLFGHAFVALGSSIRIMIIAKLHRRVNE